MQKNIIIFFGPPGSGKGTQAEMLVRKTGWKKISTGDLLRNEVAAQSRLGKLANRYMQTGKLVPDKLLIDLVAKSIKKDFSGFILDGYPRNSKQMNDLLKIMSQKIRKSDNIYGILVTVSDREVKRRLGLRRVCSCGAVYHLEYNAPINPGVCDICGQKLYIRNDDQPKVINHRLKVYHRDSRAVLGYWQKQEKLIKINGEQPIKRIHEEIVAKLKELKII